MILALVALLIVVAILIGAILSIISLTSSLYAFGVSPINRAKDPVPRDIVGEMNYDYVKFFRLYSYNKL